MIRVTGHRGAAGVLPENTVDGFEYAIGLGCDFVECDVQRTADGHPVIMHDHHVDRTTNGTGEIATMSFQEVRALDAGGGRRVPTLQEVLETTRGRTILLCELKQQGVEETAVQVVRAQGMQHQVIFTSFDADQLQRVRDMGSELLLGYIVSHPTEPSISRALSLNATAMDVHHSAISPELVERITGAGMSLRAWNPDSAEEWEALIGKGVTDISSNRPDLLLSYLREKGLHA